MPVSAGGPRNRSGFTYAGPTGPPDNDAFSQVGRRAPDSAGFDIAGKIVGGNDDLFQQYQDFINSLRGGGGGGGGTRKQKIIDLDPFKNKELDAMRELLKQQTQGTRTELTGDRARIGNAFQRFEALRNKKLRDSLQTNRGSAQRRGFLDSGVFLKDAAELSNVAAGDISTEDVRSSTLVDALSRQIGGQFDYLGRGEEDYGTGTLEALRSAQEASSTADIERSYLNARISQGGQG